MNQSKSQTVDLRVLDASFQADPTNPLVADLIYDLVAKVGASDIGLESELYRVLTSGVATMATHALLAERHTWKDRDKESRVHLERVHHALPLAIKNAWMLTKLNVKEQRLDEAERVATITLKIVEAQKMLKERYSCELLELLAEIYETTGRIEKAVDSLDHVLTVRPNSISSRQSLVRLHNQMGNEAKAREQRLEINRIQEETGK
jgi:tetratricopeptide (TPR) repeat protein